MYRIFVKNKILVFTKFFHVDNDRDMVLLRNNCTISMS